MKAISNEAPHKRIEIASFIIQYFQTGVENYEDHKQVTTYLAYLAVCIVDGKLKFMSDSEIEKIAHLYISE